MGTVSQPVPIIRVRLYLHSTTTTLLPFQIALQEAKGPPPPPLEKSRLEEEMEMEGREGREGGGTLMGDREENGGGHQIKLALPDKKRGGRGGTEERYVVSRTHSIFRGHQAESRLGPSRAFWYQSVVPSRIGRS